MRSAWNKNTSITIAGAVLGGYSGIQRVFLGTQQGYYGMVLPGRCLLGIGAGFGRSKSIWVPVGWPVLAAVALGLFTEWKHAPFAKDDSLGYFVRHIHDLNTVTLVMVALGGALGFWMPFRRTSKSQSRRHAPRAVRLVLETFRTADGPQRGRGCSQIDAAALLWLNLIRDRRQEFQPQRAQRSQRKSSRPFGFERLLMHARGTKHTKEKDAKETTEPRIEHR